jgi:amidohydrolase
MARSAAAAAQAEPLVSEHDGAGDQVLLAADEAVGRLGPELVALSHDVHAHPEEGFAEHRTVRVVAELLQRQGVDVQVGVHGLETALRASTSSGNGPHVAVLAEYDALPGVGHACGHNVICASAVGAFLAARAVLAGELGSRLGGTVTLLGTPAEEGGGGKETMARNGALDGVDAVVMLHPFSADVADHPFLGRRQLEVRYTGVAAHASAQPFMGRNALDAVVAGYQSVAMLRQHIPPSDRVHGVILEGGERPNVVPASASARYYLRSAEPDTLRDLAARVEAIMVAAAAMTGCGYELTWDAQPAYLPVRHNTTLAARWARHQERRGRRVLARGVVPEFLTGSTDLGNLSVRVPSIHPMIAISGPGVAMHTVEFAQAAASEAGDRAVLDGAAGLAGTVLDVLADGELLRAAEQEFTDAGGPIDVSRYFDQGAGSS